MIDNMLCLVKGVSIALSSSASLMLRLTYDCLDSEKDVIHPVSNVVVEFALERQIKSCAGPVKKVESPSLHIRTRWVSRIGFGRHSFGCMAPLWHHGTIAPRAPQQNKTSFW